MKLADVREVHTKRENGAWVTVPSGDLAGMKLRVRSGSSEIASKLASEIWSAASVEERKKTEFQEGMEKRVMHEAILLGWSLDDEFTPDSAREALEMSAFREAVNLCSGMVGRDGKATLETDAKN